MDYQSSICSFCSENICCYNYTNCNNYICNQCENFEKCCECDFICCKECMENLKFICNSCEMCFSCYTNDIDYVLNSSLIVCKNCKKNISLIACMENIVIFA